MSSAHFLSTYTLSIARDPSAMRILSILYRDGSQTDDDLKRKSSCEGARYFSIIRELFRSRLIAPELNNQWLITDSALYVLNRFNIPEITARSLVDEIAKSWQDVSREKSKIDMFISYCSRDEEYFEGAVPRLRGLLELMECARDLDVDASLVSHSLGSRLLWTLLADPNSLTRSQSHKTLFAFDFEGDMSRESKAEREAVASNIDQAFENVANYEKIFHFACHGQISGELDKEDLGLSMPAATARLLVFIHGYRNDSLLETCVLSQERFGTVFLDACHARDNLSYQLLRRAVIKKAGESVDESWSDYDIGASLDAFLREKAQQYRAAKRVVRNLFFVREQDMSSGSESAILEGLSEGAALTEKD